MYCRLWRPQSLAHTVTQYMKTVCLFVMWHFGCHRPSLLCHLMTLSRDPSPKRHVIIWIAICQGSQTRGPREAPMRPANIRKNEDLKGKIELFTLLSQINWILTHNSRILYSCGPRDLTLSLMRPASPFDFETPAIYYVYLTVRLVLRELLIVKLVDISLRRVCLLKANWKVIQNNFIIRGRSNNTLHFLWIFRKKCVPFKA